MRNPLSSLRSLFCPPDPHTSRRCAGALAALPPLVRTPPQVAAVRGRRYNDLLYSVEGKIARITFNRPEKRNALSGQMRDEMTHAMKRAEADDAVSCVLLCGAGPSFCSGYDLTTYDPDFKKAGVLESEHFNSWTDQFARSCVRDWMVIWDLMKPVVAMIQGNCVAGGTEILSIVDIAFVAEDARIGYPAMRGMTTPDTLYFPWCDPLLHGSLRLPLAGCSCVRCLRGAGR